MKLQKHHKAPENSTTLSEITRKGHFALTSGDAEVLASPGKADAISNGGYAVGGHRDASGGWNIAAAGPGMGMARSEAGPGSIASPYSLEDGDSRYSSGEAPGGCRCCVIM